MIEQYKFPLAVELQKSARPGITQVSKEVSEQIEQENQYASVRTSVRDKIIYAFLICAGFYIVYGFSKFRVIIPVMLGTLLVSFAVEYLLLPSNSLILVYQNKFLYTVIWIAITLTYYALSKKIKNRPSSG